MGPGNTIMPYSFGDQLDLLYASYRRTDLFDQGKVRNWGEIRQSADHGQLTHADWQTIHSMFQAVAKWGEKNGEEWFQVFSRWFGASNHSTKFPRDPAFVEGSFTGEKKITVASDVDPDRLGVLLYVYGLAPIDSPLVEGLSRYVVLDPELRTHFTDEMLVVEQALTALDRLSPPDVTPALRRKLREPILPAFLRLAFVDHKDLLFEHDSLPVLLYNTVLNSLWEGKPVNIYRVHINMTTLNEQDDTGELGNIYLRVVRGWFQEKFGCVHVVQNPERTTFEFVASSANFVRSVMSNYEIEVRQRIATTPGVQRSVTEPFVPRAVLSERTLSRENLYRYAIRGREDLEAFRAVIEFNSEHFPIERWLEGIAEDGTDIGRTLSVLRIDFEGIKHSTPAIRKALNALIVKAALGLNAELAAQTSFFENEYAGNGLDGSPGLPLFVEADLPEVGSDQFEQWKGFLDRKVGYVGPGQYDPARNNPKLADPALPSNLFFSVGTPGDPRQMAADDPDLHPAVAHLLRIVPRLAHVKGQLSHSRPGSEGGFLEQFNNRLHRLAQLPDNALSAEVTSKLADLKVTARALLGEFRKFYALAVTDPRNTWTAKQHREFALHRGTVTENFTSNFFVQEVALSGNTYIAALEYDSFRAFNEQYATHDDIDSDYNRIRDAVFVAAKGMNLPMPIINPAGGDHISISFSDRDHRGVPIDPMIYCKWVQQLVREAFEDKPFHDYHKVRIGEFRLQVIGPQPVDIADNEFFAEEMRRHFNLQARPRLRGVGDSEILVSFPLENAVGKKISAEVIPYLRSAQVETTLKDQPTEHIVRLPMWVKNFDSNAEWFFGSNPPPDYVAFQRTLSVTMALGEHRPLRGPQDVGHFVETEDAVSKALGEVKRTSWPTKEGFVDFREGSPIHRGAEASPVPSNRAVTGRDRGPPVDAISTARLVSANDGNAGSDGGVRRGEPTRGMIGDVASTGPQVIGNVALELRVFPTVPTVIPAPAYSLLGQAPAGISLASRGNRENSDQRRSINLLIRLATLQGLTGCHSFLSRLTEVQASSLIRLAGTQWRQILVRQGFAEEASRLDSAAESLSASQKASLVLAAVARSSRDVERVVEKWTGSPTGLPATRGISNHAAVLSSSVRTIPNFLVR